MEAIGPYKITGELGRGAMGVVLRGLDPVIGRDVAIKIIRSSELSSPEERQLLELRFSREAAAAGRLNHPNIVTIYQFGKQEGLQYLVMEFVDGESLDRILNRTAPTTAVAVRILQQVAAALDHAHENGVCHRDVKPGNVLVSPSGRVKLTDFGIARLGSENITQASMSVGTLAYMSPEQIKGGPVDGRADQFSLAILAYQLLAGRRPFEAETDHSLMFQIIMQPAPLITALKPELPPALSAPLQRALSKEPSARYPNCAAFVHAVEAALQRPAVPPPAPAPAPAPPAPTPQPLPQTPGVQTTGPTCRACGNGNIPNARFCGRCRAPIGEPAGPVCPNCGNGNIPNARFCGRCRTPLTPVIPGVCPVCQRQLPKGVKFCPADGARVP